MSDAAEKFKSYQWEHARLYSPEIVDDLVYLAPVSQLPPDAEPDRRPQSRKGKKWKKSKSPSPDAASRARNKVEPQPPVQYDLWDDSVRTHLPELQQTEKQAAPYGISNQPADSPPLIEVLPPSFVGNISYFEDMFFEANMPGANRVALIWRDRDGLQTGRVEMDHIRQGIFDTTISIGDGDYLIAYDVDGCLLPPPDHAQRVSIRPEGVFASVKLARNFRAVALANRGATPEIVSMESDAPWLIPEDEFLLPPGCTTLTSFHLLPRLMKQGRNEALLKVLARRNGDRINSASIHVCITSEIDGAVPALNVRPGEFGWILQGSGKIEVEVDVRADGSGKLAGMIFLPSPGEAVDFQLEAGAESNSLTRRFIIDTAVLSSRKEGAIKITLITDSYLSNYRMIQTEIPYQLVYLKKSLPALTFGKIRKGLTRTLLLDVVRSDGREIDLEAQVSSSAARYLEAYRMRPDRYSFRFDSRQLEGGTKIDEILELVDRSSGLRDKVRIMAEVVAYQDAATSGLAAIDPASSRRRR